MKGERAMTSIIITVLMIGVAVVISSVLLVVVDLLSELEHLK
jgi:FlaG/FlaF family flagellin (archaellin)